jgi:hypothetical protein
MEKIQMDIAKIQDTYYSNNNKNSFFKKVQKTDIAKEVCNNIDINTLLNNTLVVNGDMITIQYPLLKLFCHSDNYEFCINYIMLQFQEAIKKYGKFTCMINLEGFTISAAERHRKLIEMFCRSCLNDTSNNYSGSLEKLNIINSPNIMDSLYKLFNPFIDPQVKSKINIISKK